MKKKIAALFGVAFLFLCGNTSAQTDDSLCASFAQRAGLYMEARQTGYTMEEMLALLDTARKAVSKAYTPELANHIVESYKMTLIEAYKHPIYSTKIEKEKAIEDYRNSVLKRCLAAK